MIKRMWSRWWNENWKGQKKYSDILPQCHVVHHKSHMTCAGIEQGLESLKAAPNSLSYGTALILPS
jgi:hypothetical protein